MDELLIAQVEELGLSNKEARVYVANLMLGPAGVQQIADCSGIKRVTTYVILESLASLGLVSQTSNTKKTLFNAEAPENLRRLMDKREQSLRDQKKQLKDLLPQLKNLTSIPKDAPTVKFYEGAEGIRTITKSFYKEVKQDSRVEYVYGISNLDDINHFFPMIAKNHSNPDRVEMGVRSRYLYTSIHGPIYKSTDGLNKRESRYLPPDKFYFSGDISICGNYVAYLELKGTTPIGIVIKSPELANTLTTVFGLAWESASTYNL